jgi:hypothetical protein
MATSFIQGVSKFDRRRFYDKKYALNQGDLHLLEIALIECLIHMGSKMLSLRDN